MASQVLSGSSNPSYTNNTGQNVRVVINFMAAASLGDVYGGSNNGITINWAGVSASASSTRTSSSGAPDSFFPAAIGRNVAAFSYLNGQAYVGQNMSVGKIDGLGGLSTFQDANYGLPTELILASGQTFSATCGAYNIVVIPEAG